MHPKPIRGVPSNRVLKRRVHVAGDIGKRARFVIDPNRNLVPELDVPPGDAGSEADGRVQRAVVALREQRRGGAGGAFAVKEWDPNTSIARVLIGEQTE